MTSFEVGEVVEVKNTNWHGVVREVDEEGRLVRLDVYRATDPEKKIVEALCPYTFDEVAALARASLPVHFLVPYDAGGKDATRRLCNGDGGAITTSFAEVTCEDCIVVLAKGGIVPGVKAELPKTEEPKTLRERMRVRSPMPELDDVFVRKIDFPGTVVRPGHWAERSFAPARECRVHGLSKPKGLTLKRIVLKVGADFRAVPKKGDGSDPPYTEYTGKDCLVYEGDAIKAGEWKKQRLAPELSAGLHLLVLNETNDDLRFEGTIKFVEDRVPEPDHEDV